MTLYSLVLFVHVSAVLGLCAVLSFEALSLFHLRRVSTTTEVRRWLEPVPGLPWVAIGSMLVIFFSGIYLAAQISAWSMAWPKVTIGALLLIAPLGALTGRRIRAIRQACADAKAINSELLSRLQDPFLKISLGIRIAVFLGIVLLMATKPELWASIIVVGISIILGLLSSVLCRALQPIVVRTREEYAKWRTRASGPIFGRSNAENKVASSGRRIPPSSA